MMITKHDPELVEAVARWDHDEAWSGWMKYMFSKGEFLPDGSFVLDSRNATRWARQVNTKYEDLSEGEKESDRTEAVRVLDVISEHISGNKP